MKILYKDEDIIVCVKPYGMLSQSDNKGNISAVDVLSEMTKLNIYPVHRLDKTTGGVMVFAFSSVSASKLSSQITDGRFKKEYLAVVSGKVEREEDELCDLLYFDRVKNKSYIVKRKRAGVKEARLKYKLIESKKIKEREYSLLKIRLFTGRTHQIRVQFASRGMWLSGDKRYGAKDDFKNIALWSESLSFNHPITNQPLYFKEMPQGEIFEYFNIKITE